MLLLYFVLFSVTTSEVLSANILFITTLSSPSHHIWNEALVDGLLANGHNITLIGHDKAKILSENYTVLQITGLESLYGEMEVDDVITKKRHAYQDIDYLWYYTIMLAKLDLKSDALEKLLSYPRDMFELIVFDVGVGQCYYPLIDYFGNPTVVGTSPFALPPYILDTMGSHFYSYYPIHVLPHTDAMTFLQRVENVILHMLDYYLKWYYYLPRIYRMAQERFGKDITPFDQVEKQIGILLANYDPVFDFPQPLPPHIIPVGGLHIKPPKKLPDELQHILDNANEGVIYFSLGTNIQPSWLPIEKRKIFLNAFKKLKQIVLWKYDADDLGDIPKNVIIRKWFPQNNILAHKNVKLFITHSGSLSTQEAMYHGVPIVGIPFFIDQRQNSGKMEAKMLGKTLDHHTLTLDILYKTIIEVISNKCFKENMQTISDRVRDQIEPPLPKAIFWIEYALKHKNLSHLSIRARDMSVYQRQHLDVFGFITLCLMVSIALLFTVIKLIVTRLILKKRTKLKQN